MNQIERIFPADVISNIRKNKLIPRKIKFKEKLKRSHKYYLDDYGVVIKIIEVMNIRGNEYYTINYNTNFYACIPYPVDPYEHNYELLIDYNKIYKESIINDGNYYTGAEIRYWFVYNNINLNEGKYADFMRYLDPFGKDALVDNVKYTVVYKPNNKKYKCKIKEKS